MRKILLLLFFLPVICFAQKQDSVLFNGATRIIIKNNKSAIENYQIAAKALLDQNYTIEKSDKEFNQLWSGTIKVFGEGTSRLLSIYVVAIDNSISIVGNVKRTNQLKVINVPQDTENFEVLPYRKSLLIKNIFEKISIFARSIQQNILYSE